MKISIDGSVHEGGGSILRVAVPVAAARGDSIEVFNIRANRKKPGLRLQHLLGLRILADLTGGTLEDGRIGSQRVTFKAGSQGEDNLTVKVETAASIPLIVQSLINYVSAGGKDLTVSFHGGGTHTNWAPTLEYLQHVTSVVLEKFGLKLIFEVKKLGFFPKGGAELTIQVSKRNSPSEPLDIGTLQAREDLQLYVSLSESLRSLGIPERIRRSIASGLGRDIEMKVLYSNCPPGIAATLVAKGDPPFGASVIGQKGLSSEKIGSLLVQTIRDREQPMDEHLSDQLLVPLVFSPVGSTLLIHDTPHVHANLSVISEIFGGILSVETEGSYLRITRTTSPK